MMSPPRRVGYSCLTAIILIQTVFAETKVKRNDDFETASTGFTLQSTEPTKTDDKSNIETVQRNQFQKMAMLRNLNYMNNVILNLETEHKNFEHLFKTLTSPNESQLQLAAKFLLQKTMRQLAVLHQKKIELIEMLNSITVETNYAKSAFDVVTHENLTSSTTKSLERKEKVSNVSKAICQFFVFGALFGIVVTITICTCFFQSKQQRRRRHRVASISMNLSRIPEPFVYSKPCLLRADASGRFYASPLDSDEIPPLPTYEAALAFPRSPS